jgi:hypothetical protein
VNLQVLPLLVSLVIRVSSSSRKYIGQQSKWEFPF